MLRFTLLLYFVPSLIFAQPLIKSPSEFLGYATGKKFTRHHRLVDYFEYLGENSNKVTFSKYGKTYEERPLFTVFITSENNHQNLDQIRKDNLIRAGM